MSLLPPSDITLIRSQPQEYHLYLSLYQPEVVFSAQLNQFFSGTNANRIVPYSNITTGTFSAVLPNFVMMVGKTPGGNEYGVVRVRSNSATGTPNAFVVAANSHINWVSGAYLTVLNYIDVEAIYPRMAQTASQSGTVDATFYKDYDIPHVNQNVVQGTFVCMGPHRATFRDPASGLTKLYWSSSGTTNISPIVGTQLSYQWEFEGGTPTGSTLKDPGYISYNRPGHYRTRLTVYATGTSGDTTDFGVRFVSIYDQPDAGPKRPIVQWEIQDLNGSRKSGGYVGRVKIWERVGPEFVRDGQLVVMFSDDYYGGVRKNLGGNAENCQGIFWVGYVMKGTIIYDYKEGTVEFQIGSVSEMMKQAQGFSISCQDDPAPNTWFKIQTLSVTRSLWHYLKWHTTVFNVVDFQYTGDDRAKQYFDSNRQSMYEAISKFMKSNLKGELVSDRQGKLWAEISADATFNAPIAFPVIMPLGPNDWTSNPKTNSVAISSKAARVSNGPQIMERYFPEVSYVEYGGIVYHQGQGTSDAILAAGPGLTPAYKGDIDHMEGMILSSQTQLNQIVGASYAYQNSRFPEIAFPMAGAYKNIDIAPIQIVQMNMSVGDTPRQITLVNEPFHPTSQEWRYFSREKSIIHTLHLAQLVNSLSGDTVIIATTPPPSTNGFSVPSLQVPPTPFGFGGGVAVGTQQPYAMYHMEANGTLGDVPTVDIQQTRDMDIIECTPATDGNAACTVCAGLSTSFRAHQAGWYQVNFWVLNNMAGPGIVAGNLVASINIQNVFTSVVIPLSFSPTVSNPNNYKFGGNTNQYYPKAGPDTGAQYPSAGSATIWLGANWGFDVNTGIAGAPGQTSCPLQVTVSVIRVSQ